jgi:hypothetical protein
MCRCRLIVRSNVGSADTAARFNTYWVQDPGRSPFA